MDPTLHISRFFTWGEAIHSATAARRGIDNTPDEATMARIIMTARHLDDVRLALSAPVLVNSWYRSPALNKAIGSKPSSQHILGEAVDFRAPVRRISEADLLVMLEEWAEADRTLHSSQRLLLSPSREVEATS
jgi:hypothetical protein